MDVAAKLFPALGRVLLSLIFVIDGYAKIDDHARTISQMASHGVPYSDILVWAVIALELGGGLLLLTGLGARWIALVLAVYTLVLAFMFHAYWGLPPDQMRLQHAAFYEHLGLIGGMLYVAAFGAGPLSLDALMGRRKAAA